MKPISFDEFIKQNIDNDSLRFTLITQFEEMVKVGHIGTCELRTLARQYIDNLGVSGVGVVGVMKEIAFECYKYFAKRYLNLRSL